MGLSAAAFCKLCSLRQLNQPQITINVGKKQRRSLWAPTRECCKHSSTVSMSLYMQEQGECTTTEQARPCHRLRKLCIVC